MPIPRGHAKNEAREGVRTVMTRPTRSTRKFQARVMQAEPVKKMRQAMAMARFRPKRSAVLPAMRPPKAAMRLREPITTSLCTEESASCPST